MLAASVLLLSLAAAPADDGGRRLLDEATARYRALQSSEAARLYEQYLARYPDRADVRFYLGAALFNLNQLEAAAEQARRALELDGNYARAYALLGRVHTEQKDWRLAEEAYQTALRLDGQDRDTWYFLGRCYYEENRFKPALEAFQRALSLKAEYSRTYENLALTYEALSQYGAAEKAYRRAIELAGSHYRPFFAYGVFLYKQMRTEESLLMLQKSVQADPNAAEARFRLGTVLLRMGRLEAAAAQTERALDLARECRFRYQLIRIYIQQGRMAEADEQARQIRGCETHR